MQYYIYHIPGIKVGCTKNLTKRVKQQGFSDYHILEVHDNINIASDRELYFQKLYGYKIDASPYSVSAEAGVRGGSISKPGANSLRALEENRNPTKAAHARPKAICPHCGKEGLAMNMRRWHFDNCKHQ